MRAIVCSRTGGPEVLALEELPEPEPTEGRVRVRVRAAGVCYRDVLDRKGAYPMMKLPVVPGHELAGEVEAVGPGVERFRPGDRVVNLHRGTCGRCDACRAGEEVRCTGELGVFGLTLDGGYAEKVLAPESSLVPLPAEVPFEQAAFLHCTAAVALRALRHRARLQAGERVLVTGASGGVGIHAVQLARLMGAEVIALTTSERKADALRQAGAHHVVVAAGEAATSFHGEVRARSGGGVDVVLDLVAGPLFNPALRSLRPGGRLVLVGNISGERVQVNPGYVILNELAVSGSSTASRRDLEDVLRWAAQGALRPVLERTYGLAEAAQAQQRLEAREAIGRSVLDPTR